MCTFRHGTTPGTVLHREQEVSKRLGVCPCLPGADLALRPRWVWTLLVTGSPCGFDWEYTLKETDKALVNQS